MIAGLTCEYAHARICAGVSQRPTERLWQRLRAARSVPALLDLLRASTAAPWISGIPANGDGDVIELAVRQQMRARIDAVASWTPEPWHTPVLRTRELTALPALVHLLTEEPPPRWISFDAELGGYALHERAQRRAAIAAGPYAALANALGDSELEVAARPAHSIGVRNRDGLHGVLRAWLKTWQATWPEVSRGTAAELLHVVHAIELHVTRFGLLKSEDTALARQALALKLTTFIHRFAAQPAELFAYLALFALDLERLRWEFMRCARPVQAAA